MKHCVFWIGSVMPNEQYRKLCDLGYHNQQASRIAQMNIVSGLKQHYGCQFRYISGPALPAYPTFRKFWPNTYRWTEENGDVGIIVSYPNIEYLNREFKSMAMVLAAKEMSVDGNKRDDVVIYVNSPHTPFINCALSIKAYYPRAKMILVVPDLPQYMELKMNPIKKFLKNIDYKRIQRSLRKFDGFVLYTKHMAEAMGIPKDRMIVMEGCVEADDTIFSHDGDSPFTFMYSGKVDYRFGMKLMVDAFRRIPDQNCRLIITGTGDAENYIRRMASQDKRIEYFGFVEDYSCIKKMQNDTDILLNMRLPSEKSSMYCFPSKLFEYMKTGNPVISFQIGGIPDEYYDYLLISEGEDVASLSAVMGKAMQMTKTERKCFGEKAKRFVLEQKNVDIQTKRIFAFAESLQQSKKE